jgi:hypothetical protein
LTEYVFELCNGASTIKDIDGVNIFDMMSGGNTKSKDKVLFTVRLHQETQQWLPGATADPDLPPNILFLFNNPDLEKFFYGDSFC